MAVARGRLARAWPERDKLSDLISADFHWLPMHTDSHSLRERERESASLV